MLNHRLQKLRANSGLRLGLLLGISCALIYGLLTDTHDWGDYSSEYIIQARSILGEDASGFIENATLMPRESTCIGWSLTYPWGFPLLLAPFYKTFGLDFFWLKMVGVICYLAFLIVIYRGFAQYHSSIGLLGLTALFALNPTMLTFLNNILADIPFLLFSTLCVILIGRTILQRRPIISFPIDYLLLGAILCIAFLIRNNGALLIILTALTQFISYAFRQDNGTLDFSPAKCLSTIRHTWNTPAAWPLAASIPYLTLLCLLGLLALWDTRLVSAGMLNLDVLDRVLSHQTASRIAYHTAYYTALPKKFFGSYLLYAASVPFVLIGIKHRYKHDYHILLYMALILLLHIIWPGRQGLRYIFPLLPFYVSFLVTGIEVSYKSSTILGKRINPRYLLAAAVITLSLFAATTGQRILENHPASPPNPSVSEAREMFRFIKHHTATQDIIIFPEPRAIRLMTGRMAITCRMGEDISAGDYLVIHKARYEEICDDASNNLSHGKAVFENTRFMVIKI